MLLKNFLIASLLLVGCTGTLRDFPGKDPVFIIPKLGIGFQCHLINADKMTYQCDQEHKDLKDPSLNLEGGFCLSADQFKQSIDWAKDAKDLIERQCKAQ